MNDYLRSSIISIRLFSCLPPFPPRRGQLAPAPAPAEQMGEISVRVSRGCNAFINLHRVRAFPRDSVCQSAQRLPRSMASNRHDKTASLCHRVGVGKYFDLHRQLLTGDSNSCSRSDFTVTLQGHDREKRV